MRSLNVTVAKLPGCDPSVTFSLEGSRNATDFRRSFRAIF